MNEMDGDKLVTMINIKKWVNALADEELKRAVEKHGWNNSTHEGYALMLEEWEELHAENIDFKILKKQLWEEIKNDKDINNTLEEMEDVIKNLLAEGVQVLAMLKKMEARESNE